MEQMKFNGDQFDINEEIIIRNALIVADFFGSKRNWYEKLKHGGQTYSRTSLDSSNNYDEDGMNPDENDLPPLDPSKITGEKAKNIAAFFRETPEAKKAFEEDYEHARKSVEETS